MMKKLISLMLALSIALACAVNARAANVLEVGSRGNDVVKVQKRLIQYDYLDGEADGRYGESTRNAVRLFQKRNGLTVDGKVGPATAAALGVTLSGGGSGSEKPCSKTRRSDSRSAHTPEGRYSRLPVIPSSIRRRIAV